MSTRRGEKEGRSSMSPVHSANQWEAADFDDNKQKEKFLRLMGGMKKQHTGRFVIGETNRDAHSRTDDETKEMEKTLEEQYQVGLEKKLTGQNRRHIGLGFSEPEEKNEEKAGGTHVRFDEEDDDVSKDSETFHRELEGSTKDEGDGKRDAESEKGRRAGRQKQDAKSQDRERERRGSREQDPERETEERDRSHRSSRDEDRKYKDRDDRKRKVEKDEARRDSKTSTSKSGDSSRSEKMKHRHSEEGGESTEQKSKKHKHQEDDSGSD